MAPTDRARRTWSTSAATGSPAGSGGKGTVTVAIAPSDAVKITVSASAELWISPCRAPNRSIHPARRSGEMRTILEGVFTSGTSGTLRPGHGQLMIGVRRDDLVIDR